MNAFTHEVNAVARKDKCVCTQMQNQTVAFLEKTSIQELCPYASSTHVHKSTNVHDINSLGPIIVLTRSNAKVHMCAVGALCNVHRYYMVVTLGQDENF